MLRYTKVKPAITMTKPQTNPAVPPSVKPNESKLCLRLVLVVNISKHVEGPHVNTNIHVPISVQPKPKIGMN